jgi:hypothetical protein
MAVLDFDLPDFHLVEQTKLFSQGKFYRPLMKTRVPGKSAAFQSF